MKYTLLKMTQLILASMDSDEVNSVSDTAEAIQVAGIIESSYNDLLAKLDFPERFDIFQLTASGSSLLPVTMTLPSNVDRVMWLRYNKEQAGDTVTDWQEVHYMAPEEFAQHTLGYTTQTAGIVVSYTYAGTTLYGLNNVAPTYWTSFDDKTLLFDTFDISVDTTLQTSKTMCYGRLDSAFSLDDAWVAPIDSQQFSLLLNEAKAMCFAELKQADHKRAEKKVRDLTIKHQSSKDSAPDRYPRINSLPNYGRTWNSSAISRRLRNGT